MVPKRALVVLLHNKNKNKDTRVGRRLVLLQLLFFGEQQQQQIEEEEALSSLTSSSMICCRQSLPLVVTVVGLVTSVVGMMVARGAWQPLQQMQSRRMCVFLAKKTQEGGRSRGSQI